MTILTGAELEVLMGLRMSWGRLYWNEIVRLQNEDGSKEDDSKHGADCGADLAHGPANRNEKSVTSVLHEMRADGDLVGGGASRLNNDRSTSAHSQLTANVLRLPK
jgi:hypothetical protein